MAENKTKHPKTAPHKTTPRRYDADTLALQSLRLIAAPNPKDDLSREEVIRLGKRSGQSPETIQQIIEYIKSI